MKKLLVVLLTLTLLLVCALAVNAANYSGKCGDNLTWTLSGNTLTISGTGDMYDYSLETPAPWAPLATGLRKIIMEEGVTSIGNYAFYLNEPHALVDVIIAGSVTRVGDHAFYIATYGKTFRFFLLGAVPEVGLYSFQDIHSIYVVNWDDASKKKLNVASSYIKDGKIVLNVLNSNQLISLNAPLKPEDLTFEMYASFRVTDYKPRQLSISAYDNSTYGQKDVTITVDGFTFDFTYFVTDGTNHLDLIQVEFEQFPEYNGRAWSMRPKITMGTMELVEDDNYDLEFTMATIGNDSRVTVTGMGIAEGFEKTFYYPILKKDLTGRAVYSHDQGYQAMPVDTHFSVASVLGKEGQDYEAVYENNINTGVGNIRAIGKENYYGEARGTFRISLSGEIVSLPGECIGTVNGELSDQIPYYEQIVMPVHISARPECSVDHLAAYALYRVEGDDVTLIEEYVSDAGNNQITCFLYDFRSVYEDAALTGGEVYLLSYSWVTINEEVYAGAMVMIIPSKVPEATSMTMEHIEGDGDFRQEYFSLYGNDGTLGQITWKSSDPSVAVVEKGTVTMKKPGTVTISGQWGDLVETYTLTVPQLYLNEGIIFDYSEAGGARVIYDSRLLTEGTDYVLSVTQEGDAITVTASGQGLFTGELVKTFDGLDALADPHTHSFDNSCDGTCNGCSFTRSNNHQLTDTWKKNLTHHYHTCTVCGQKEDLQQHILSAEDETICIICGLLKLPGDCNGDLQVNNEDVIHLLWYTMFPESYPLEADGDVNGDGHINNEDVIHLLWHTMFPDNYPIA